MQKLIYITDESMVGQVRRELKALCDEYDCGPVKENASIVVTELASNGIKHAKDSSIIIKIFNLAQTQGIEIIYMDRGPGFDIEKVQNDGFSTAGSLGFGLGAIKRLSDECHFYSQPGRGTCIVCRLYSKASTIPQPVKRYIQTSNYNYSYICVPIPGEEHCGDEVALYTCRDYALAFVADGLGHGEYASKAALLAKDIFYDNVDSEPEEILKKIDRALYSTRGAAVSIAKIQSGENKVIYSGVGNICGTIIGQKRINMVSHNGTLGMGTNKIQTFTYPWNTHDVLILHSDGISAKWTVEQYADILHQDLSIISGVIFRDYHRPKDDTSLIIVKEV